MLKPRMHTLVCVLNLIKTESKGEAKNAPQFFSPDYRIAFRPLLLGCVSRSQRFLQQVKDTMELLTESGWAAYDCDQKVVEARLLQKPWVQKVLRLYPDEAIVERFYYVWRSPFTKVEGDILSLVLITKDGDVLDISERDVKGEITKELHQDILSRRALKTRKA